jgi:peptide deformylase
MCADAKDKFQSGLFGRDLELRTLPDEVLRENARQVHIFDDRLRSFLEKMFVFMRENRGIGLAAPQVGILYRLIAVDIGIDTNFVVNPEIVSLSENSEPETEGCLSIPGREFEVDRPLEIEIRGLDPAGREISFGARGLDARVLQHEIDHLNGVLICDNGKEVG